MYKSAVVMVTEAIQDFGTNWKIVYDFPLVNNTNLHPILLRF